MMRELLIMKEVFAPIGGAQSGGALGQVKELVEVMTLLKGMNEPEKEETNFWGDLFGKSMPLFAAMVNQGQQPPQQINQPPQQPQQHYQPNPTQRRQRKRQGQNMMHKQAVAQLLTMCEQNMEPDLVAEQIAEQIPDQFLPQIESLIGGDDAINRLINIDSKVADNKEWFLDVIEWLKGYLGLPSKYASEFDGDIDLDNLDDELTDTNDTSNIPEDGNVKQSNDGDSERQSGNTPNT
jgi:hypothetical protein